MRVKFECPIDFIEEEVWEDLAISINKELIVDEKNPECIIVNPGANVYYDKKYFEQFKNLKVVGTPSTGVNHMDTNYLNKRGIKFCSLLDNRELLDRIEASAEFTWLHIMNAVRKFSLALKSVNGWRSSENEKYLRGRELYRKKLGIIGLGRIGKKLVNYATAFGMDVKFYDPYVTRIYYSKGTWSSKAVKVFRIEDLKDCDIISINCYLTEETENMITQDVFRNFKQNLIVVNTSRGEVVDEEYILALVILRKIIYSCDVLRNEQNVEQMKKSPLYQLNQANNYDNLIITPHVAGVTVDSQTKAFMEILTLCMK